MQNWFGWWWGGKYRERDSITYLTRGPHPWVVPKKLPATDPPSLHQQALVNIRRLLKVTPVRQVGWRSRMVDMGVSKNRGPQNGWFIMETLLKWMIWGYHYFWKHPYVPKNLHQAMDKWFHFFLYWLSNTNSHNDQVHKITRGAPKNWWLRDSISFSNGIFCFC